MEHDDAHPDRPGDRDCEGVELRPNQIVINSVANTDSVMQAAARSAGADFVNGSVSSGYLKNPTNPKYRNDAAVRQYRSIMAFGGGAD